MSGPAAPVNPTVVTLAALVQRHGGAFQGDAELRLTGCATLEEAGPSDLSFLANRKYIGVLGESRAGCVVLPPDLSDRLPGRACWVHDDPYFAFRQVMIELHGFRPLPPVGIAVEAYVDDTAEVGELCTIRPGAYVARHARLGNRVILYPGVHVGKHAVIGDDCVLHPGVCVYDGCVLGKRVVLHANTVIGQDGFGYATSQAPGGDEVQHHKLPNPGNAVIEDDVEMGASCAVDRATLGSTVIGRGTKFSNHVVIGHGCRVGPHNLYVAGVGLAGSVTTGAYVVMGGQAGVAGHLTIGDGAKLAAGSKVMHDVPAGQEWGGMPAQPLTAMKRAVLQQRRLPDLAERVRHLEHRLAALESRDA
ncbi:MAG: UDP-3-O-(3-hydroxymyristoyl)glucosamine N-acyltransferase [Planctomycetota bacterium]